VCAGIFALSVLHTELNPVNIGDSLINSKKWSSMVRVIIWSESLNLAINNPILGTGLRSYPIAILPFHKATWMEVFQQPHNLELMLWIETGLPGLIVFAWLCVIWIRMAKKKQNSWIWIAPLIALLVHGFVDVPYFKNDLAMQFWILAALASFPTLSFRGKSE
jgi:O-antigen ligase